jgi:autotransporter-associated beta strand protein
MTRIGGVGIWRTNTFASLGLLETGTFVYGWGPNANQKLTLNIGTTPVGAYWDSGNSSWGRLTNWLTGRLATGASLPTTDAYLNNGSTISLLNAQTLTGAFVIGQTCSGGTLSLTNIGTDTALLTAARIDLAYKPNTVGNLNFDSGTVNTPLIQFGHGAGAVNFRQNNALSLGSLISGAGTVRQQGAGTTTLTANNNYTGPTEVTGGRLLVNGTHTGGQNYSVSGTGTLGGIGTLSAGVVVNSGGTLSPGPVGAVGEFTIGSLTLNSGGALRFTLNGGSASFLKVTGAVNLNGGVNFSNISAPNADLYPLLSAGTTLSGAFGSISAPGGYEIFYGDENTVFLRKLAGPAFTATGLLSSGDSVIVGGQLPFDVSVVNSGATSVSFTAASGSNTAGSVGSTTVNSGDSINAAGLFFNGTTVGANQSGSFSVTETNSATTTNLQVSGISVYAHASGSVVDGTNLVLAPVHVGYSSGAGSTNSITVSNAATNAAASLRANLGVTNNNTNLVSLLGGVAPGSTGLITGSLAPGLPVGQSNVAVTLQFYDDSNLPGATNNLGTTNINVSYYVYSGQGVWTSASGGNWSNIANWQVPGGTPGLDGALSTNDTAFFGTEGNGPVTLNSSAQLRSITFSNASPYAISGGGAITLAAAGGTNASITTLLGGQHTISNPIVAGSALNISNAAASSLNLAGAISGSAGLNKLGAGTTTLGGVNTYIGATVVSNGTLVVTGKLANNAGSSVTVNSGGTLSFGAADVFGPINADNVFTPLVIDGGVVNNTGNFQNILGDVVISNGGILRSTGVGERGIAFSFSGKEIKPLAFSVIGGPGNSRIEGPGIALGNKRQAHTWFHITNNSTMTVAGNLVNGINSSGAGTLIKYGEGTLVLAGTNTYTGTTIIWQGTVQVGDGGTSGNLGAGNVEMGQLIFNRSDSLIVPNVITGGNGDLIQIGTGTVTLSGRSTYAGRTTVSNGVLAVTGTLANSPNHTITVNSNAAFEFGGQNVFGIHTANISTPIVINGGTVRNAGNVYNALGPITMNGGTLLSTGANADGFAFSLKGPVTVNSNSTIAGPGITLGAASVNGTTFNVTNGATLTVNGGLLNGASATWPTPQPSSLTKAGAGTMVLNGTNTYTGTTTISAGTLSVGGAGVLGGGNYDGNIDLVASNSTLVMGSTANQTLGGAISGAGALVKTNAGILTITGTDNVYSGTTTIAAGTLVMDGWHNAQDMGNYILNTPGTLAGTGHVGAEVTGNGTISPGSPGQVGELTIGELTNFTGLLNIRLDGDEISRLTVSDDLDISNVNLNFDVFGTQGEEIYIFLANCNGIIGSGAFSSISNKPSGYSVIVDADDGVAFLQTNSGSVSVTAFTTNGVNAVIGSSGALPFQVLVFNGLTTNLTNISSSGNGTNIVGSIANSVPLVTNEAEVFSGLTFTNGTPGSTNTATFDVVTGGVTNAVEYEVAVYDNARGSIVASGTNPVTVALGSAIVDYTNPLDGNISVSNAPGFRVALGTAASSTNRNLSFTDARGVEAGSTGNLLFALTNQGVGFFTNNVAVRFFDDSDLSGASTNLGTQNFTVTGAIYNHASAVTNGTNLAFRPVRQGTTGLLISTNSINISNLSDGTPRVALGSANTNTNNGLSVGSVQGLAAGSSMNIGAVYDLDFLSAVGLFTNFVDVRFFDDSTLDGAADVGTMTIQVTGYVYTGQGVWLGGNGDWTTLTNWQVPGGTPGLDGALSANDTALFGTGSGGSVNLTEDAALRSITFSNTNSYTIRTTNGSTITLAAASGGPATLANLAGAHTISNNINMGSALFVTNAAGTDLTLAGVVSGFDGLTKTGPGTLVFSNANTYSGTTTVNGGTLTAAVNSAFSADSGLYLDGGTIDIGTTTQNVPSLIIASGTHAQTNGVLNITAPTSSDSLILGSTAGTNVVYNLIGGTLSTDRANFQLGFAGEGTFNQTGGLVDIGGYFVLGRYAGGVGIYNLTGGIARQSAEDRHMIIGEDGDGEMTVGGTGLLDAASVIQLGQGQGTGTLRITNGGVVNAPGINLGSTDANRLIFDISSSFGSTNFAVPITGAGSVVKAGTGTVVFDQNNSYGGTTTISNGTLVVNGIHSSAGTYTVQTNAVLAGTGEIDGFVLVQDGGTINPGIGGSNEEFKISGLEIQSGGILNVVLGGATTSQLQVAGGVTLGSTSVVNFSTNAALTEALYPFLTYGGALSGTFGETSNVPGGYEVIYDPDDKFVALLFTATNYAVAPVFDGENAVITGGTLPFDVLVYNNTATNVAVASSGGSNTTGSASGNIPSETSDSLAGLSWSGTNVGLNQTGNFTNVFTPPTGPTQTNTINVTVSVYDHASNVTTGNNLAFAPVHARNANPVAATNSITVSNLGDGVPRVALGITNISTNRAVSIDDVRNLAQGDSIEINGLLDPSLMGLGRFTNTVQLIAFDDSRLNGAITLNTNSITVTGYVYSGQGEWNTMGGGDWANINDWDVPGGTPGLDGEYSVNDTAFFGTGGTGPVTNNGSVQMLSMTFSNATSYDIVGDGTITLTASGGNDAAITTLAGAHTVSNTVEMGSDLTLSNAAGSALTLAKPVDGAFGLIKEGDGTTTLGGVNTYTGGTTVNAGTLNVAGTLVNDAGSGLTINGGAVALSASDVFGRHNEAINAPIVINEGGELRNSGAVYNALGEVTLNGGSLKSTGTADGYAFLLKGPVTVTGTSTSTITGPGLALGADTVDSTAFNVADGATLLVNGGFNNGPSAAWPTPQASALIKAGAGEMIIASNSSYTGNTIIEAGTLTTRAVESLGKGGEVQLNGGVLSLETGLNVGSFVWDAQGQVRILDAVLDDVSLNIANNLTLIGGGPFNFDLLGNFIGSNPTKIMSAANMGSYSNDVTSLFSVVGGLSDEYIFAVDGNDLLIKANVLVVDGGVTTAGTNTFAGVRYVADSDPDLEIPVGSLVTISSPVVMSNNSVTTVNGTFTSTNGFTVQSGSTLGGAGTINGAVKVAGTYAPGTNAGGLTLRQNGNLTFNQGGAFLWTLYANTNALPGQDFSSITELGTNKLTVPEDTEFQMFFAKGVDATNDFWDANEFLTNTWTVMNGTDLAEGTMFRPVFAEGSVTDGFNPTTFFFRVTNNSLTLNFSPGLVVFPEPDEFVPGNNNYPWVVFEPNADLEIPVGVNVVIKTNVVISNTSKVVVNGQFTSLAGQFTLQNGNSLGGNGTINGSLISSGLLSPGSSPGTLSIGGNFTQTSSGTFLLEAASLSNFDRMNVSGAATVDGTLAAIGFGGNNLRPGDSYQFLTADGGISGEFDTISVPAGLRGRFLISGANNKFGTLLIAPATYTSMATTPNQFNVAQALDNFIGATGDRGTVSAALDGLSASQYPAAFEQMMPSQYASLPSMAFNVANALNSSMFQQLWVIRVNGKGFNASGVNLAPMQAEMGGTDDMGVFAINPSKDTKWSSFVDGNGVFANASSTGSVQNYRSQSGGVSTGAAYSWTDAFATGVYVGYQGLQAEYNSGRTIDNAVRFGVFGTYDVGDFYFNGLVGGAYHGYTVNRYINFGGLNRTATGRPGAGEFDLALGTGYDFDIGNFSWGPFTTMQYTYIGVQGFNETGAGALNLDVDPYNSSSLLYTLGAQAAYNWKVSDKVIITPTAFAGWQHEFLQNSYGINSTFATGGPAAPFNYNTSSPARDNFYGGVGVTVGVGESWQATFIYSASAANQDNSSQNLYLGLGYKF